MHLNLRLIAQNPCIFKKKHQGGSAEFTKSAFKFKDKKIYLAKCTELLPIRWSRRIPEACEPSTVTVRLHREHPNFAISINA